MAHFVTDRIVVGLQRSAAILALLGILGVISAVGWTTTAEALQAAAVIAVLAFGFPAAALFALAYWLDTQAAALEGQRRRALAIARDDAARHPFREPAFGYAIAVLSALAAWVLRMLIDPYLPGTVPFITYFVAVAVSAWVGGYGPAVFTTALAALIFRYFYMLPAFSFQLTTPTDAVRLGTFVFVCIAIGGLTAALHAALRRVQTLANELKAVKARTKIVSSVPETPSTQSVELEPDTDFPSA